MIKLLKHDNILYQCLIEKLLKNNFQTFFLAKCLFIKAEIKTYNYEKIHSFNPAIIFYFIKQ
jgi:hypothetical protein